MKRDETIPVWHGYSEPQRQAILDALPTAWAHDLDELIGYLHMTIRVEEINPREFAQSAEASSAKISAQLKAIEILKEELLDLCDEVHDDGYQRPIAEAAPTVLQTLRIYEGLLCAEKRHCDKRASALKATPNRQNWFQHRFFRVVAKEWTAAGGTVDYSAAYRKFWTAVVHPPFQDEWVKKTYNVALSEGTFQAHVTAFKNKKNRTGL